MNAAILVAAGKSSRMGRKVDKLFLEVAGRPVVAHTWQRFNDAKCIDEIILVVRDDGMQRGSRNWRRSFTFKSRFASSSGGAERQDSVWNGLEALSATAEIVAIHDAARPCTSEELIAATVQRAEETGAAVAAQPVTDTIKESADGRFD